MKASLLILVTLPFLLLIVACGPKNELGRISVSGEIKLDGQPLDQGTILFTPEQPRGVSSGGEIVDGVFAIEEHQGLTPGDYTVRIYAADEAGDDVEPQLPGPGIKTKRERIPFKYNLKSELKLEVSEADEQAVFDLDMKSK